MKIRPRAVLTPNVTYDGYDYDYDYTGKYILFFFLNDFESVCQKIFL